MPERAAARAAGARRAHGNRSRVDRAVGEEPVAGPGVAGAAGVCFGFYPAWQAARLDPIAALRGK